MHAFTMRRATCESRELPTHPPRPSINMAASHRLPSRHLQSKKRACMQNCRGHVIFHVIRCRGHCRLSTPDCQKVVPGLQPVLHSGCTASHKNLYGGCKVGSIGMRSDWGQPFCNRVYSAVDMSLMQSCHEHLRVSSEGQVVRLFVRLFVR